MQPTDVVAAPGDLERAAGVFGLVEDRLGSVEGRWILDLGARTGQIAAPFIGAGAKVVCAVVDGVSYEGKPYREGPSLWSGMGTDWSFWFTPESLDDAVHAAGWSTVEPHEGIRWAGEPEGRAWLVLS
jgi:hypothetical protein